MAAQPAIRDKKPLSSAPVGRLQNSSSVRTGFTDSSLRALRHIILWRADRQANDKLLFVPAISAIVCETLSAMTVRRYDREM